MKNPAIDAKLKWHQFPLLLKNFADKETENIWNLQHSKRLPVDIQQRALNKLAMISQAVILEDLKIPPANHQCHCRGQIVNTP